MSGIFYYADNSHFEKVIERLKQIEAEENENADNDDLTDMGVDEVADEGISNADVFHLIFYQLYIF